MGWKLNVFGLRMMEYIRLWPLRFVDFFAWIFLMERPKGRLVIPRWFCGLIFKTIDLTPLPQLVELIRDLTQKKVRGLNVYEKELINGIYGNSLNLDLIGINPYSLQAKKKKIAFVSFHTINFFQNVTDSTLIHEVMHIWQYRKYGSNYIPEALYAQKWGGGYSYGGKAALERNMNSGMKAFNFEQQAVIVEDYFLEKGDREVYRKYLSEVRSV